MMDGVTGIYDLKLQITWKNLEKHNGPVNAV